MPAKKKRGSKIKLRPVHDWRTTDQDEIDKRRQRARDESFHITNTDPVHPIFSNFKVKSGTGLSYSVEIRGVERGQASCECVDFRINGLAICKHVEAVLNKLRAQHRKLLRSAGQTGSTRWEITLDRAANTLRLAHPRGKTPRSLAKWFDGDGSLKNGSPEAAADAVAKLGHSRYPQIRISQDIPPWLAERRAGREAVEMRRLYEQKVQRREWPAQETTVPLFPYQREGMLHLAFKERALLADEMGLGKTIQAIAACALLHRLGQARRVLVVTPASLKSEWEEQIQRFTPLEVQLVYGTKLRRLKYYDRQQDIPFFTIVNYEQMVSDALDVNQRFAPDVVVLDEAQRIKNWNTKTAQAVKRLRSRYAFVLTGTPIENRIDELHSLMDFLKPSVLGPLFRFNRDFYELDDRGRPVGFRNLDKLHQRIQPFLLRRRKSDVESELPERTDRQHFVPMHPRQRENYASHEQQVMQLATIAQRRPLSPQEQDKLQRELAMMRMICDTNYILDEEDRICPKLAELEKLLEECNQNNAKVIVFSEWERMLKLVREHCDDHGIGYAWHTGTVPQKKRRAEINAFKEDPDCRIFLSTDSGATGLNLQAASVIINCDLPWNPAKLEQRIARAWRKHQSRAVTVINLISEDTIEHRMLDTLARKQTVATSVLDKPGEITEIKIRGGRQAMVERLQQLVSPPGSPSTDAQSSPSKPQVADPARDFARRAAERLNGALVRCEERYPQSGSHSVLVAIVARDVPAWKEQLKALHAETCGKGKTDPLAPLQLEVLDEATENAIQRLIGAGMLSRTFRAARPLFPAEQPETTPLSPGESSRLKELKEEAGRSLKMARLLGEGGFADEARPALEKAALALGRARAVEGRLPEPSEWNEILQPPLSHAWTEALPTMRAFSKDPAARWKPVLELLEKRAKI